jgi:hypothetical protein
LIKNFKKITLGLLTAVLISSSTILPAFAADKTQTLNVNNKAQTSAKKDPFAESKWQTGPSSYEHDVEQASLDKDDLWQLKSLADDANNDGTTSNYVSLASFLLGCVNMGLSSTLSGTFSYMLQSRLNAYDTLDYAFTEYRNLDENPNLGSIPTMIPLERFYYGNDRITDWYPCKAPYEAD